MFCSVCTDPNPQCVTQCVQDLTHSVVYFRESTNSDLSDQERAIIAVEKLIDYVKRDDKRNVRRLLTRYGYVLGAEYAVTPGMLQ